MLRKYHIEITDRSLTQIKLKVSKALEDLVNGGDYEKIRLDRSKNRGTVVLYYERGKNISALHNYMVSEVVRLIKKEGYVKIEHVAESGELSNADITTNFKEIEVETGLQKKLDGLKKRIDRAVTTSNKEVLIIVPNKYVRQRYDEFVKDYAQGRVLVRTFGEFEDSVLAGLEMLKRGKTKQEE